MTGRAPAIPTIWSLVRRTPAPGWPASPTWGGFSDDQMCLAGADETAGPGAVLRGGCFGNLTSAGVFTVIGSSGPFSASGIIGFRGAR